MIALRNIAPWPEPDLLDAVPFREASKALIAERQLLRRIDSKYVVRTAELPGLLAGLDSAYAALRIPGGNWATYRSLYLDTPDLRCFHDHRRGRRVRHKIRVRHYPERGVSFLEVKTKRSEDVTQKHRVEVTYGDEVVRDRELAFLRQHVPMAGEVVEVARIDYRRLSLIALGMDERVTIDVGLEVAAPTGVRQPLGHFAVIEIKRARLTGSPMAQRLFDAGHHERSISKYCAAIAALYPGERRNRLEPTLKAVARIASA
jgi:hypothetical protein